MSDIREQQEITISDDDFRRYAEQVQAEETTRKNRTGFTPREFEEIKWTGLEKPVDGVSKMKVLRALGGIPNTDSSPFTARTVRIASIICDDKKTRRFIFPSYEDNKGFLPWRIINNVLSVTWDNDKKKTYVHETAHPSIFQMVENNSFPIGSMQQKTTYGWSGRDMFLMNVINRGQMDWHRTNKHSMLMSKDIRLWTTPDGKLVEFPEQGIPAWGFVQMIASELFRFYGNWNNYDIGIERTGAMNTPYRIINCEKNPEKISKGSSAFVSGPLTAEELSWEMYDLRKLFKVSSYIKWWNHLHLSIASIDVALGTHYHDELQSLMEAEKKQRVEEKANSAVHDDGEETATPDIGTASPAAPVELRANNAPQTHAVEKLPDALKQQIDSYGFDDKGNFVVKYKTKEPVIGCTVCRTLAPKSFTMCPKCGVSF